MYSFKEQGHQHFWNGKRMTGVTTVLGIIAKPALIGWASNMCADYILANGKIKDEDFILVSKQTIEEARKAHAKKKEAAGDIGTKIHEFINLWIMAEMKRTAIEQ